MSKIFLNGELIWSRNRLPTEKDAEKLFIMYVREFNDEMKIALSCGIDIETPEGRFHVVLSTDERIRTEKG